MLKSTFGEISRIVVVEFPGEIAEGFPKAILSAVPGKVWGGIPRDVLEGISEITPARIPGEILEEFLKYFQTNQEKSS